LDANIKCGLNMASEVESASTGLHRSHIVAPPLLYRHSQAGTAPNRNSTGTGRGYVGTPPWHTVAKPGSYPSSTLNSPCLLTTVSHGGLTVARRITPEEVRYGNMPALVSLPVSPYFKQNRGHSPVISGSTRFIPIQCGSSRRRYGCRPGWPRCPN
jgi:hypothetical protein